jgi:diguanylate cyclase (GGDEF)-like protein
LGVSESFDRLADLLSQFVSQVTNYRWIAVLRHEPARLGIHTNALTREQALKEAFEAFELEPETPTFVIEDDDAAQDAEGPAAMREDIYFGDRAIGMFALAPRAPEHRNDRVLVGTIARELAGALRMATLVEESRWMATTDALTGLLNRRAFLESTTREVARAKRYNEHLSVVLLDVDHFKHINDKRGHAAGDIVLSAVGKLLNRTLRTCDIVARWGGEEFVLVLPNTSLAGGEEVAERVRGELCSANIKDGIGDVIPVTASFGVATYGGGETLEQVIDRADRAMYLAKSGGRNRVVCDQPELPKPVSAAE